MLFKFWPGFALAALVSFSSSPAFAIPSEDPSVDSERDEYDFSWLDPDKKIYVVQNRKFTKAQHLELATGYGIGMGEEYRKQRQWNFRGTFYFNEHWGVSAFGFNNYNSENDTLAQLKLVSSAIPSIRDTNRYFGGSIMWLPFYGKINIFNQIFYIDWDFEFGLGQAQTEIDLNQKASNVPVIEEGNYTAFHWGTGWKFFITRHWAARLDFLATYYKAPSGIRTGGATTGSVSGSEDNNYDSYYGTLGVAYTF